MRTGDAAAPRDARGTMTKAASRLMPAASVLRASSPASGRGIGPRPHALSLRARVGAALAVLVFVVAGLVGTLTGESSVSGLRDRIGQSLASDAARMAERLDSEMAARARELALIADLDLLRELAQSSPVPLPNGVVPRAMPPQAAPARVQAVLDGLMHGMPAYRRLSVTDPFGRVLASTDPSLRGSQLRSRDNMAAGESAGHAGPLTVAPGSDPRRLEIAAPIRAANGSVLGVILAELSWQWVADLQRAVLTTNDEGVLRREMFLLGLRDVVLVGPAAAEGNMLPLRAAARARAGFDGWLVETWPDDVSYLTGAAVTIGGGRPAQAAQPASASLGGGQDASLEFSGNPGPGPGIGQTAPDARWVVVVRQAVDEAFAPAYQLRLTIVGVGVGLAAAFAGVGWLIAGWITAPLKRIAVAAERLRNGDDVELPSIRGAAEIESLSASLRALVATLTRRQSALLEMQGLALRDPLTGLLNRNGLRSQLLRSVAEAYAEGTGLLVFMGDLDGFKGVNDTLGHAIGDQLLHQVAARLTAAVRVGDVVARLGGDEFVLALRAPHGSGDQAARSIARRALAAVTAPYNLRGKTVKIGFSLGGACWPEHVAKPAGGDAGQESAGVDGVLERADAALYIVKRSGKGRILIHGEADSVVAA